jgi:hypothetical protein
MSLLLTRDKKLISNEQIPQDPHFQGMKILRSQSDKSVEDNFFQKLYQIQHDFADYRPLKALLCRKGTFLKGRERIVIQLHLTLKDFVDIVRYDPSKTDRDPGYDEREMKIFHEKTQSDFKGQKAANKEDFKNYILEGINGQRTIYLPTIAGWQSKKVFDKTVFLALDEEEPDALYGIIYLPRSPIMQADGQTQTAALFAAFHSAEAQSPEARDAGVREKLTVSLEVELNVDERKAGQSFADRNGRGSKKNKTLVIGLDKSSAISDLRAKSIEGTVFEKRLATGRNNGSSETATGNIVNLSDMEQMLLNVVSGGTKKAEHFKHHHVDVFLPFAQEFLQMLDELFREYWLENTPAKQDTFKKLYVHAWPFCLKALALAYHKTRLIKSHPT